MQKKVDQVIEVSETEARSMTKRLAKEEGIFAGMSSGGSVSAAKTSQNFRKWCNSRYYLRSWRSLFIFRFVWVTVCL